MWEKNENKQKEAEFGPLLKKHELKVWSFNELIILTLENKNSLSPQEEFVLKKSACFCNT